MKLAGVKARQRRKFKATTNSKHDLPIAPNLLTRRFSVKNPDHFWAGDIPYIWTSEGWLYLAVTIFLLAFLIYFSSVIWPAFLAVVLVNLSEKGIYKMVEKSLWQS